MYEIDNQKFGVFLLQLRKEHGMTQKDLAERLFVSDKAVSKWERDLSLPDIALLQPLADILNVTVTELLAGQFIRKDHPLNIGVVDPLVQKSLYLTSQEQMENSIRRRRWKGAFLAACLCAVVELAVLFCVLKFQSVGNMVILSPLLAFIFGIHFIFSQRNSYRRFTTRTKLVSTLPEQYA
ncbi:MAG: helix-turn-helix transcriptional regulator [Lachnospiraceae bacterium]|nr:helix-turn-helix transcriptional regulator [Lachnospiraceae bacterium]